METSAKTMAYGPGKAPLYICNNHSEMRDELGKTGANSVAR
jgi:hypothetical protein